MYSLAPSSRTLLRSFSEAPAGTTMTWDITDSFHGELFEDCKSIEATSNRLSLVHSYRQARAIDFASRCLYAVPLRSIFWRWPLDSFDYFSALFGRRVAVRTTALLIIGTILGYVDRR